MKRKMKLIALLIATATTGAFAASKGVQADTEERTSKPYHHISIKGDLNVQLIQNETPGVIVEGSRQQVMNTVTMLNNDTLYIYSTENRKSRNKAVVKVNVDEIVTLNVNGNTKVESVGVLDSNLFTIKSDGGAEIKIDVKPAKS